MEQGRVVGTQRNLLTRTPFEATAMNREPLNQQSKELCVQISAEKNPDRMLALVTELNDLLQNQREQKPSIKMRFDEISNQSLAAIQVATVCAVTSFGLSSPRYPSFLRH